MIWVKTPATKVFSNLLWYDKNILYVAPKGGTRVTSFLNVVAGLLID